MTSFPLLLGIAQTVLTVGPHGHPTIERAIVSSGPGDTIVVEAGVYDEHLEIHHPLVILGKPGAVVDGGGEGRVIQIFAPVTVAGLTIRGSGTNLSQEHAGLWATEADDIIVRNNVLEDVLFGVYIKQSRRPTVSGNRIVGKPLEPGRRGDGIRFWYSANGLIADNDVRTVRDVVVWFSDSTRVEGNTVIDSRYGLHYMYSNFNRFTDNRFERNEVGAFLMYSHDIVFERNTFAYALGPFGKGLGFKDTENVRARSNLIVKNSMGVFLDNSPLSRDVINDFSENVIAFNEVGIAFLPSVKNNHFGENTFLGNIQIVSVTGGGSAMANVFRSNFWSEYAGFDEDRDGRGDTPYILDRVTDDVLSDNESLQLFRLSSAAFTLDALGKLVPVLKPTPLLIDSAPMMEPHRLRWPVHSEANDMPRLGALLLMVFAALSLGVIMQRRRSHT